jgi:predicted dithiol-disulfide oxidoreductase (DUF899 family)
MPQHRVGTREEWAIAREPLLAREKEYTRLGDELAQLRRELPWVKIEKTYRFDTTDGARTLADLFDGRSQLAIYHFMFGPQYSAGCPACSSTADSFNGVLPHLKACDVTLLCVSRAPLEKLLAYRERMGWSFDWASSYDNDFNFDFGVSALENTLHVAAPLLEANELQARQQLGDPQFRANLPALVSRNASSTGTDFKGYFSEGHGFSVLAREGDSVYHCYSSYARGTEFLMGYYAILDRMPKGRNEDDGIGSWLHRHDEYNRG